MKVLHKKGGTSADCGHTPFFFIVVWLLNCGLSSVSADSLDVKEALQAANSLRLDQHRTWLKLLHIEPERKKSSVLSDSFFVSNSPTADSQIELNASVEAFFSDDVISDMHPVCRFPARYFWLSKHIDLPTYNPWLECPKLRSWGHVTKTKSVSLLMVSGYFGNPASTFGHSLLKFNQSADINAPMLQDISINYGVSVPENENSLRYIVLGLTGGYKGKFSDSPFYNQDLTYSRREYRDMWEYRLSLEPDQLTLLILHLFEIIDKKYQYLFLDKNCGFRIAELIDLVTEEKILDKVGVYYAPVALFHRLNGIDNQIIKNSEEKLVASVTFIPSARRKLSHELSNLNKKQVSLINTILESGISTVDSLLLNEDPDQQIQILNSLLAYHHYLDMTEAPNLSPQRQTDRNTLLYSRLKRSINLPSDKVVKEIPPPTMGFAPTATSIGLGLKSTNAPQFIFSFSPYRQHSTGFNSLEGGELVVADVEVGLDLKSMSPILHSIEFIRALSINVNPIYIRGMSNKSWRFRFGVDRKRKERYDGIASGGLGKARKFGNYFTGFAFADLELHTTNPHVKSRLELGSFFTSKRVKLSVNTGIISENYVHGWRVDYRLSALYRISKNSSIEVIHRADLDITKFTLSHYF